jgi:hypothetical protein
MCKREQVQLVWDKIGCAQALFMLSRMVLLFTVMWHHHDMGRLSHSCNPACHYTSQCYSQVAWKPSPCWAVSCLWAWPATMAPWARRGWQC